MNNIYKYKWAASACLLIALGLVITRSDAQNNAGKKTPGWNTSREVTFLKSIRQGDTWAKIKKRLPASARANSSPATGGGPGGTFEVKGPFIADIYLVSRRARKEFDGAAGSEDKYRPTDSVNFVWISMDQGAKSNRSDGLKRLDGLKRILGKPFSQGDAGAPYEVGSPSDHWAKWRLPGGGILTFNSGLSEGSNMVKPEGTSYLELKFKDSKEFWD